MSGPRVVSIVLAVLGLAIVAATMPWPPGSQGVPGPAVVPRVLGVALVIVSALIYRAPGTSAPAWVRYHRAVPATMGLLAAYALFWRVVPHGHGVLTGVVLIAFLRITGLPWRAAGVAAVLMATVLQVLFERGLGVRF
ncbi:Tripartite tricarboxylate transporter TctB family protein [Luteitalea pratensis]|jgi:hypothetical protein|uniref:Tripartite tricarboxylate transporter TctB family protein n=1 Tax=Luteitalea pratensis TaxID=1855912 RepID=A0A143PTP3_LUTPR|nr:tripartite tricarboxylate transporter TctB family protein [Luteitalea pratensis]AMY11751.1 Tripartite tricarboxylate transporter TctB family protein [Luteitalea pratensis]